MKTTSKEHRGPENDRELAWGHLFTPHESANPELAQVGFYRPTGELSDIAQRFDRVVMAVEAYESEDTSTTVCETDLLAALLAIRKLRDKLVTDETSLIAAARRKRITWARIGQALELRSRQAAERRYLQLRSDANELTQAERVEFARAQRQRQHERSWAGRHADTIRRLAQQLAALPDLQERADRSPYAKRINEDAVQKALHAGRPRPEVVRMQWPVQLRETLRQDAQHREATKDIDPHDLVARRLKAGNETNHAHRLLGLVGYAVAPETADLRDQPELVAAITALYTDAGEVAPRKTPPSD
ncbi:hypothetical protein G5C51_11125 [Streptomyces sp. A7024]|uniref:Uncharacterized protein n=1 Tax=Streptomyces coryli TaxID=1128680 RepID=A0A6G4TXG1_9ACTN|nr:hypothetical protein [Streptomyces coryli]NGN64452.1 hypothetical protein [Streptomyces coryli]